MDEPVCVQDSRRGRDKRGGSWFPPPGGNWAVDVNGGVGIRSIAI